MSLSILKFHSPQANIVDVIPDFWWLLPELQIAGFDNSLD